MYTPPLISSLWIISFPLRCCASSPTTNSTTMPPRNPSEANQISKIAKARQSACAHAQRMAQRINSPNPLRNHISFLPKYSSCHIVLVRTYARMCCMYIVSNFSFEATLYFKDGIITNAAHRLYLPEQPDDCLMCSVVKLRTIEARKKNAICAMQCSYACIGSSSVSRHYPTLSAQV